MKPWMKFAILGSTYARALENAATRGGRALSPAMTSKITQLSAQPRASLQPGLGQMFREHAGGGELPQTPQRAQMQDLAQHLPWAGEEHTTPAMSAKAEDRFNRLLQSRGLSSTTPAGQPTTQQRIDQTFGRFNDREAWKARPSTTAVLPAQARGEATAVLPKAAPGMQGAISRPGNLTPSLSDAPAPPSGPLRQFPRARFQMGKTGAALPLAAGIAAPIAVGGALLASKPGIRANMRALTEGGSTKERDVAGDIPEPALNQAAAIRDALTQHGLDPATVRMGIDAPPGSGKTTLARALAQQAGMKNYGLDWEPGNWWKSTVGLGRNVEKMPRAPHAGEVLEHYMLGRTYDPELFDAMVHIHRDPSVLRQQLQHRGHGAYIGDLMDLDKSLGVADLGFNTLGGETVDLGDGVQLKLRPREGWGNALDQQLMQKGIDPTGLSRHEKLLSLHAGKRETGAGWTPYVKSPFSGAETAAIGASVPLGVMAARALARRPP